jgi:hypothetical protein
MHMTAFLKRLHRDTSGLAMIEFAYSLPLLVGLGGFGLEMTNLANVQMKVAQSAMALADNMSRVGIASTLSATQIREADVVDSFIGVKRQVGDLELTEKGRIILSSLEQNASGGQWIHWQRCIGKKVVGSTYGVEGTGITGTSFPGMGPTGAKITAPNDSAVMVVEIKYDYQPLFTTMFIPARTITYESSFIVRDNRDLTQIYNPSPAATVHSCNLYTA